MLDVAEEHPSLITSEVKRNTPLITMCSIDSTDKGPEARIKRSLLGSKCVKCDAPGVLITRIHDSFCKDCFQVYVVHKFRSAIGKSKLIRDGEKVLVAFSGGTNSAALLHLIQDGLSLRAHKRLRFTPTLIHVDESALHDIDSSVTKERKEQIKKILMNCGFPSYWTQLEQGMHVCRSKNDGEQEAPDLEPRVHLTLLDSDTGTVPDSSTELADRLQNLIKSIKNTTAQEDFVKNLRNQLLIIAAQQLGFTKLLTAESSSRLAVRILSDVAQGRGSQVSLDTGIADERNEGVMIMRPVRDLNAKELAMYNSLFGISSVFTPTLTTKTALASSIERLTETFVTGLQADFPSTVSNIVRTSEKLGLPDLKSSEKCRFCQSPLDTNVGTASALGAILFSEKMSRNSDIEGINGVKDVNDRCSIQDVREGLCFGCRLSLHGFDGDMDLLPALITGPATKSIREMQHEEISEFLLEEDE